MQVVTRSEWEESLGETDLRDKKITKWIGWYLESLVRFGSDLPQKNENDLPQKDKLTKTWSITHHYKLNYCD